MLGASIEALDALSQWDVESIETALREALLEGLGLKPRVAFGALRVAVTGAAVSPPLFESMDLLGRDRTMARLRTAFGQLPGVG